MATTDTTWHKHTERLTHYITLTRGFHSHIVVRVYTHIILLEVEVEFTVVHSPELVLSLQVRPTPETAVDDMREPLPVGYLEAAVQVP